MDTLTLGPLECLTTAPKDYDYGWMRTIRHNVAVDDRGKVYRLARNDDKWHFDQQVMRYGSGMNATITDQKDLDGRIRFGFLTLTPDKAVNVHYLTFDAERAIEWKDTRPLRDAIDKIEAMEGVKIEPHGMSYHIEATGDENRDKVVALLQAANMEVKTE